MLFNLIQLIVVGPFLALVYKQVSPVKLGWKSWLIIFALDFISYFRLYLLLLPIFGMFIISYRKLRHFSLILVAFYTLFPWVMDSLLRRFSVLYVGPLFGFAPDLFGSDVWAFLVEEALIYALYFVPALTLSVNFKRLVEIADRNYFKYSLLVLDTFMLIYYVVMEFLTAVDYLSGVDTLLIRQVIVLFCFAFFIGALIWINNTYKRQLERELSQFQASELKVLTTYVHQLENLYQDLRAFRHDYVNILATLNDGIRRNDMSIIKRVYDDVLKDSSHQINGAKYDVERLVYITDDAVKSVLATKLFEAQNKGVEVKLEVLGKIGRPDLPLLDFIRVLSIFCDNALEAAIDSDRPQMIVALYYQDGNYCLSVSNSTKEERILPKLLRGTGYSSKGSQHGLGLGTVKLIAEKYRQINWQTSSQDYRVIQTIEINKKDF